MGSQAVDPDPEPVHAGVVRPRHQDQRSHRHVGRHVYAEGAVRLIDAAPVDDRSGAVADLFPGLPGKDHLSGKQVPVPVEDPCRADQGGVVGVVSAGVHLSGAEALIRDAVCLRYRETVDVGAQDDAALFPLTRLRAFDFGIDARHRDAPVPNADQVQFLFDAFGGHVFFFRQFRMLMKPAPQPDDIVVILLHLAVKILFQFVHGFCSLLYDRCPLI